MIGKVLDDRYAITRVLGQGGMGAVYEARHTGTNRRVAIKVILKEAMQEEQIARFQREARIVGAVESQHITLVYDTGRDRETGAPYIAMELLDGEDAAALIKRLGPLHTDLALRIAFQACLGLDRAHRAGIVHRDIKSANLFLCRQDLGARLVKLLDFGIAKATADPMDGGLTKTGAMMGSPLYMAPEQARGGEVDARADVWSLGVTLYEMLSGVRPNEGVQQLGELVLTICTQPARWIQDVAPWVPAEVAHVVHGALVIDKAGRYPSAEAFGAALRPFLPHGYAVDETMLLPLSQTLRNQVAPRLSRTDATGGARAASGAQLAQSGSVSGTAFGVPGSTTGAPAAAPTRSKVPLLVGGVALAAALGGGLATLYGRDHGKTIAVTAATTTAVATPPVATPPVAAAPTPAIEVSPAGPASTSTVTAGPAIPTASPSQAAAAKVPVPAKAAKPITKKQEDETSRK
jgi:eukaryotic-like serine/threonine-protein kinase